MSERSERTIEHSALTPEAMLMLAPPQAVTS
jgi:hypothetical protein